MGHHEEFIYSEKYTAEEIGAKLLKAYEGIDPLFREIDVLCKATSLKEVNATQMKVFGRVVDIKPVNLHKGVVGLVVNCNNHKNPLDVLPFFMKRSVTSKSLDEILLSPNGAINYEEVFEDSEIKINGETFFAGKDISVDLDDTNEFSCNDVEVDLISEEEYKVLIVFSISHYEDITVYNDKLTYYPDVMDLIAFEPKVFSSFKELYETYFEDRMLQSLDDFTIEEIKEVISDDLFEKLCKLDNEFNEEVEKIEAEKAEGMEL